MNKKCHTQRAFFQFAAMILLAGGISVNCICIYWKTVSASSETLLFFQHMLRAINIRLWKINGESYWTA